MGFALEADETVPAGVRRIVEDRIDRALRALSEQHYAVRGPAVHSARERFKETRATLRLVRHELGDALFYTENATFRDAGRPLSTVRDSTALIDGLDDLVRHGRGRLSHKGVSRLRRLLLARRRAVRREVIQHSRAIVGIIETLRAARTRVRQWPLERCGWKAIERGLRRSYAQGRRAMKSVSVDAPDEALHEWRKRAKDLRYELELLQATDPKKVGRLAKRAHKLTDLLGDDHDLAMLHAVNDEPTTSLGTEGELRAPLQSVTSMIDERRAALQHEAIALGRKVYADSAGKFTRRVHRYWRKAHRSASSRHS